MDLAIPSMILLDITTSASSSLIMIPRSTSFFHKYHLHALICFLTCSLYPSTSRGRRRLLSGRLALDFWLSVCKLILAPGNKRAVLISGRGCPRPIAQLSQPHDCCAPPSLAFG